MDMSMMETLQCDYNDQTEKTVANLNACVGAGLIPVSWTYRRRDIEKICILSQVFRFDVYTVTLN